MPINSLAEDIRNCAICAEHLPLGPRPVATFPSHARIAIIGQAPGTKVHASGIPWDDQSGIRLRNWLGVDEDFFYNSGAFAVVPMGFCYPGKGKSGDKPPRPECAPRWHAAIFDNLPDDLMILLVGSYAQKYYLGTGMKRTLTETVRNFEEYLPRYFPLVHPSPRNKIWEKKNPWFVEDVVPVLRKMVASRLG